MKRLWALGFGLVVAAACSDSDPDPAPEKAANVPGTAGTDGGQADPRGDGGLSASDAGPTYGEGTNTCPSIDNPAGNVVDLPWPSPSNVHFATEGDTVRFHWNDGTPHNVVQVAQFEGQSAPVGKYSDAKWANELRSGGKTATGSFDWNTGVSPCGYRPGIYFFVDEDNPAGGIVSIALTSKDNPSAQYAKKPCRALADPANYRGRYSALATRPDCTEFEVNNFTTQAHFDWVEPTFGAHQGDLVLFRWTGVHNAVQVHDAAEDVLLTGGIASGPRTNCAGGPNYSCVNGSYALGEYLIDTQDHRPGMIHISDGCAYGCANCPWECHGPAKNPTGTGMEFLLARPANRPPHVAGECCALDKTKGTACRVVDLYNDNEGLQFDYNVAIRRGDIARIRWGGTIKIVQTTPNADGSPSQNPRPGGIAMASSVECIPGPNWSCVGADAAKAELLLDVDKAITSGNVEKNVYNSMFFDFYAFGENTDGASSANSGILVYVEDPQPYSPNPACP